MENLSGGELQRFAMAVVAAQEADVYMIDEPSSYLDVRQRLKAAQVRPPALSCRRLLSSVLGCFCSRCRVSHRAQPASPLHKQDDLHLRIVLAASRRLLFALSPMYTVSYLSRQLLRRLSGVC